ncbi:MAG: hypothetical protein WCA11_13115 [Terracidiphilus sp.]
MDSLTLKHFASLWTLVHYPNGGEKGEWSIDQKLAAIKAAGFDGFQSSADPDFAELGIKHGLQFLGACDANAENYERRIRDFVPLRPARINVQLGDHAMSPAEAARIWIALNHIADDNGLVLDLETHRGTCTETPEKTWQIVEIVVQQTSTPIRLTFDFSHFAVVKHLLPPYAERLLQKPALLGACRQIHLRPFNGHHCEIPATNGNGKVADGAIPWFDFVAAAFEAFLQQNANNRGTLWACPEFGAMTSGYWLPSFPDPWKDAIFVRQETENLWRQQLSARKTLPQ